MAHRGAGRYGVIAVSYTHLTAFVQGHQGKTQHAEDGEDVPVIKKGVRQPKQEQERHVDLTTDLHSMGQFIQDGNRVLFETVLNVEKSREEIIINEEPVDLDGLNYLAGKNVDFINKSAMNGTILAHTDGNVPNLMVKIPEQNEFFLGQLFYFFEFACGVSGYLLGVNPFNQPGVESYKRNMFALLGKPGYEKEREELIMRL